MEYFKSYFEDTYNNISKIDDKLLLDIVGEIIKVNNDLGKIIIIGNGGSAAIASHVSIDLTKAAGIRSINFNESSLLTCFSNDYGYEYWVEKAIEFYADNNDLIILISSSGSSANVVKAARRAKELNIDVFYANNKFYD